MENARQAAEAAEQMERVMTRASKLAAQRASAHIHAERRAYDDLMSLAGTVQPDGSMTGKHLPVKPPLPRCKTVARSHVYGEKLSTGSQGTSVWWSGWAGNSESQRGRFAGVDDVRIPSPTTIERMQRPKLARALTSTASFVSFARPPRDVANLFPHASMLEEERGPLSIPEYEGYLR